jgi:2-dehydropantoate 2-reductase
MHYYSCLEKRTGMKILILGAGAIGGYFGARLLEAGQNVTFLVRPTRKAILDAKGLQLTSIRGDFSRPVNSVTEVRVADQFDAVILSCKSYDLDSSISAVRPAVGENTVVLPLLNGRSHMERLNAEFGATRVLGGLAKIVIAQSPDGSIQHLNDWCTIIFGEQNGVMSARVQALQAAFPDGSVEAKAVSDIHQQMWEKLVHLSTLATVTCLMRASVGEVARAPGGIELFMRVLDLHAEVAKREGHAPSAVFMQDYRKLFSDKTAAYVPSILRDIERHKPIEGDHIVGYMLDKLRKHGLDASLHEISYMHLRAYEERRLAGRL